MTWIKSWLSFLLRLSAGARKSKARSPKAPSSGPKLKPKPVRPFRMNPPQDVDEI